MLDEKDVTLQEQYHPVEACQPFADAAT